MKSYQKKNKEIIHVGDNVLYKKAIFIVEKIRKNSYGKVICDFTSTQPAAQMFFPKEKGDIFAPVEHVKVYFKS